jgi:hypothetical protein
MENGIIQRMQSFKDRFRDYGDNFVIIGGAACSLILSEEEAEFRATKDVDIVLLVEVLSADFGKRFWEYVKESGYRHCQKSSGKPQFYRFYDPILPNCPEMLELFSRRIDGLLLPEDAVLTPIPIGNDISSLSAILLNDEYYDFLRGGVRRIGGLPVLDELYMIPFKAKAWLELTEQKAKGGNVDSKDIRKHKRDIYRLSDVVADGFKLKLPSAVETDMRDFIAGAQEEIGKSPAKERRAEQLRFERLAVFFGLPISLLQWKGDLSARLTGSTQEGKEPEADRKET